MEIDRLPFIFDTNHPDAAKYNGKYRTEAAFQEVLGALRRANSALHEIATIEHVSADAKIIARAEWSTSWKILSHYPTAEEANSDQAT